MFKLHLYKSMALNRLILVEPGSFSMIQARMLVQCLYTWLWMAAICNMIKMNFDYRHTFFFYIYSLSASFLNLNGLNKAWKCPKCLPDGDFAILLSNILYLLIISFYVMLMFNSDFEVLNISKNLRLAGSSISLETSAVPSIISSASLVVAPKPILSIISGPSRGVFSGCLKW